MKSSYSPRTPDMGRSRAFTLVEVLVVIAIISVLMAVLLPALSKARECAYLTGELTAGRELGQAHRMYAGDYNSYYMAGFASATMVAQRAVIAKDQKGDVLTGLPAQRYPWRLLPYFEYDLASWYRNRDAIEKALNVTGDFNSEQYHYAVSVAPRMGLNQTFIGGSADTDGGGYAFNPAYQAQTSAAWGNNWYCKRVSDLNRAAEIIIFATSFGSDPVGKVTLDGLYRISPPYFLARKWTTNRPDSTTAPGQIGGVSFRYSGRAAASMGDGHCETYNWDEMQDMRHWSPQANAPDWKLKPL